MRPGKTFSPLAEATVHQPKQLLLLRSPTQQSEFFCPKDQPKHFGAMRRSTSHSSYSSPSPSISPVFSRSFVSGDDLDNDSIDLNPPQDVGTRDYILVIGGLGFIGSHTTP
jgi:hypothetical protein